MTSKIVNACAALHNICLAQDPTYLTDDREIDDQIPGVYPVQDDELFAVGDDNRKAILDYLLHNWLQWYL